MEYIGWAFLLFLVVGNAYEFFFSHLHSEYLYKKTAEDVNFNK